MLNVDFRETIIDINAKISECCLVIIYANK